MRRRTGRAESVALVLFATLVTLPATARGDELPPRPLVLSAVAGAGLDWETAEESPIRCVAGLSLTCLPLELGLTVDCGIPWEPSARVDARVSVLDLDWLRLGLEDRVWLRTYSAYAREAGVRAGARAELGPRMLALAVAGGAVALRTAVPAIGETLGDAFPWARAGILLRPAEPVSIGLSVASDSPLALWLRTSFELQASWTFDSGFRIEALLALRYSDFFTLTACLDGCDARLLLYLPIARSRS